MEEGLVDFYHFAFASDLTETGRKAKNKVKNDVTQELRPPPGCCIVSNFHLLLDLGVAQVSDEERVAHKCLEK